MEYFGFNFPNDFLLGDPKWLKRLGVGLSPDEFDPFNHGLHAMFDILDRVVKEGWTGQGRGGCYMFNHAFPGVLKNLGLLQRFVEARTTFLARNHAAFEAAVHVSTGKRDFPLEGRYHRVLKEGLEACEVINANALVVHPPEGSRDVTDELTRLFYSSPITRLLSRTGASLHVENGVHDEFFGSLRNVMGFLDRLSDEWSASGFKSLLPRVRFCLDTGHLLLWRHHHPDGIDMADKEIDLILPEYAKRTGVLHVKACNAGKEYITPFTREGTLFQENSRKVMDWLSVVKRVPPSCPRLFCMEIPKRNFKIRDIIAFGKRLA